MTKEHVEAVLDRIRPTLIADGGNIELVDVIGNSVVVRLLGVCAQCPSAHMTLHVGVEAALRAAMPDFGNLHVN